MVSNRAFSARVSSGAAPPLDTATSTGARSTSAGRMKSHSAGWSTMLTGTPAAVASACRRRLTALSSDAPIAIAQPAKSSAVTGPARCSISPRPANLASSTSSVGAMTTGLQPARTNRSTFRAACNPPPATTTRRPFTVRNTGRWSIIRILPLRRPSLASPGPRGWRCRHPDP